MKSGVLPTAMHGFILQLKSVVQHFKIQDLFKTKEYNMHKVMIDQQYNE
jgi:hypothetical protein